MAAVTATVTKATTVAGAGLIAGIMNDDDMIVLLFASIIVSTFSFLHDLDPEKRINIFKGAMIWTKYALAGVTLMFTTFYFLDIVLDKFTPIFTEVPRQVWFFISSLSAGYALNIIKMAKDDVWPRAVSFIGKGRGT